MNVEATASGAVDALALADRTPPPGAAHATGASPAEVAGPVGLVVALLLWVGAGVWAATALVRSGADLRGWAPLALTLGPLTGAWACFRSRPRSRAETVELAPGAPGHGDLAILVAVVGRPEGVADADPLLRTISWHAREIVLVRPIGWLAAADPGWNAAKDEGARVLAAAALFVWERPPRQVLVPGHGAAAIARFAGEHHPDLVIVVGSSAVRAVLCRHWQLRECPVVGASQIAASEYRRGTP